MSKEQPPLIDGIRHEPPACFDDVLAVLVEMQRKSAGIELIKTNNLAVEIWASKKLPEPTPELHHIAQAVRIWKDRQRNGNAP